MGSRLIDREDSTEESWWWWDCEDVGNQREIDNRVCQIFWAHQALAHYGVLTQRSRRMATIGTTSTSLSRKRRRYIAALAAVVSWCCDAPSRPGTVAVSSIWHEPRA